MFLMIFFRGKISLFRSKQSAHTVRFRLPLGKVSTRRIFFLRNGYSRKKLVQIFWISRSDLGRQVRCSLFLVSSLRLEFSSDRGRSVNMSFLLSIMRRSIASVRRSRRSRWKNLMNTGVCMQKCSSQVEKYRTYLPYWKRSPRSHDSLRMAVLRQIRAFSLR